MSIPEQEVERVIPQERGALHAFDTVNAMHFRATSSLEHFLGLPKEAQEMVMSDYIRASFAYFSNGTTDPYLEELGTTAWREYEINDPEFTHVGIVPLVDMPEVIKVVNRRFPDLRSQVSHATTMSKKEPMFLITMDDDRSVTMGVLTVPPEFIFKAKNNPVETLGDLVYQLSPLRDVVNERTDITTKIMYARADVLSVAFWKGVQQENPTVEIPSKVKSLMVQYPRGTGSFPARLRYKGIHHPEGK
jgi:hypothetical protein